MHIPVALVDVDLSPVGAAGLIQFDIKMRLRGKTQGPELHGEGTDGSDQYVLHVAVHEGAVQGQALADRAHGGRDEQPVALETPYLDLLLLAGVQDVEVEGQHALLHPAVDLDLRRGLRYLSAVYRQRKFHEVVAGQLLPVLLLYYQVNQIPAVLGLEGIEVVDQGGVVVLANAEPEDGRRVSELEEGESLKQVLLFADQDHQVQLRQSLLVLPVDEFSLAERKGLEGEAGDAGNLAQHFEQLLEHANVRFAGGVGDYEQALLRPFKLLLHLLLFYHYRAYRITREKLLPAATEPGRKNRKPPQRPRRRI